MPANNKPGTDWDHVRRLYEAGLGAKTIIRTLREQGDGPSHVAILNRAHKEGWRGLTVKPTGKGLTHSQKVSLTLKVAETETAKRLSNPQTRSDKLLASSGKRTVEAAKAILERIREGASPTIAAQAEGISGATLSIWRNEDPAFNDLIAAARAELLADMQSEMPKAAKRGDWKAADRILQVAPETREEYRQQQSMGGLTVVINVDRNQAAGEIIDVTPTDLTA